MDELNSFKKAALYIRVSTHSQEELSPDSQKRLLLDYAEKNHFLVEEQWIFQENGISGRTVDKRPQFLKMIASAKSDSHPFDAILVWKFSRFARNQEESIVYKSMLRGKYGVDVISISEPIMEGPFGSLIERIIEWMDEFYSIRLSGDVSRGMAEKALRGGYQSRPPLGYRLSQNGNAHGKLELYAPEVSIVQNIFSWYAQDGLSPYSIARKLNAMGLSTSQGNLFETRSVTYILQNPVYAGWICWNRMDSRTGCLRDSSSWIQTKGQHPAIVSAELFQQAQERLSRESAFHSYEKPSQTVRHWLGGMLKCPLCGKSLSSCRRKRKTLPDTFSFQCNGYLKGFCTNNCYVTEDIIVPLVLEQLKKDTPETYQKLTLPGLSAAEKNEILKQAVEKIIYYRNNAKEGRITICYYPVSYMQIPQG